MSAKEQHVDPQALLPVALRGAWIVLPKALAYQLFLAGALLGAGVALSAYAIAAGDQSVVLRWAFPIAIAAAWLQNKSMPWGRKAMRLLLSEAPGERS